MTRDKVAAPLAIPSTSPSRVCGNAAAVVVALSRISQIEDAT
jgi:hypothetical protein